MNPLFSMYSRLQRGDEVSFSNSLFILNEVLKPKKRGDPNNQPI
ncbi:hypothetical protein CKC_02820 [Candidatus Liberibacter solanacearum CLso-ZC1]|uniref:Uncharacterized protein n=1 Tax=Liberibacter solanacearum (strain CLso-ZC1) TaxID=658172 RepID=E4UD73_LIBSC|nr:hypothetical protein CKC_02820 [Candidatus Liberibacter solanacearum CLso-ZC1]